MVGMWTKYVHNVEDIYIYVLRSSYDRIDGGGHVYTVYAPYYGGGQLTALVPCMSQYSRGRSPLTPRSRSTFALELETNLREYWSFTITEKAPTRDTIKTLS